MDPNNEQQPQAPDVRSRSSGILGVPTRAVLGEMNAKLERLFIHDQKHVALLTELRDSSLRLEAQTEEHEKRIGQLDTQKQSHDAWKAKMTGIYVGIGVTITTLASVIALINSFLGKK